MRYSNLFLLGVLLVIICTISASAQPLPRKEVPDPLKPWISWALYGEEKASCPSSFDNVDDHHCLWPGALTLDLTAGEGGRFTQTWELFAEEWVPLPASPKHWPQDVRANGKPAVITAQAGTPAILLAPGIHRVEGRFVWDRLPEFLVIPPATGLVSLFREGEKVRPHREQDGRLWLTEGKNLDAVIEDRLQIQVFRKLTDDIPFVLRTHVVLDVSGRSREVVLARALPEGFVPAALKSGIPVRFDPDGRLRVQVRPGQWRLEITARHQGPVDSLTLAPAKAPWSAEEIWSFEAMPHLRLVTLAGLPAIDPKHTGLPSSWHKFPAYLARPGETLTFKIKRRGDPEPAPDQLSLNRTLWLDFDGRGFTVHDRITGSMTRGWRLELLPPAHLGRVAVDGTDRFITSRKDHPGSGVEVRRGQLALVADSRLEERQSKIPATGWDQDFTSVQATLKLPPGWQLIHGSGADSISGTWIAKWSLLDLFAVLLITLATGKLWGWKWAGVALAALGLAYHEPGAPGWVWLHLLAAVGLVRVLPAGKLRSLAGFYRNFSLLAVLLILLPFAVTQIRSGIFPQLEEPFSYMRSQADQWTQRAAKPVPPAFDQSSDRSDRLDAETAYRGEIAGSALQMLASTPSEKDRRNLQLHDPDAVVQTGPGLPEWRWRSIPIRWSGPVEAGQTLGLYFLSPGGNMILAFVRVILLGLLFWCMLDSEKRAGRKWRFIPRRGWLPLLLIGVLGLSAPAQAEMPDPEILAQLKSRLLAPAACFPACAGLHSLDIQYSPDQLALKMTIHAVARVAVPVLAERSQWVPERIRLDGKTAPLYLDNQGKSWVHLSPGIHRLDIEGMLANRHSVILAFPLSPRQVSVAGDGWEVEGLEGQDFPSQLQLRRLAATGEAGGTALEAQALPSYFRVERTIGFGLRWTVSTRVVRIFDGGSSEVLTIPLLPGEAVTSENVSVADGQVTFSIPAERSQVAWDSVLEIGPRLTLKASASEQWSESWKLDISPVWHVEAEGIPVIHHQDARGNWLPEWRPWPGEEVVLAISRPAGVAGKTATIDSSLLTLRPGRRATEAHLDLRLRSSRGGQHTLVLPENAELQNVSIDGAPQPVRQDGRNLMIPLVPGSRQVEVVWRTSAGIRSWFETPPVNLGMESVNARLRLQMPRDRWVLFARGPRLGPAVLFWGVLLVLLPIAFGLGKSSLTPLKFHHWLLLGIGLTQLQPINAVLVVGWLLALGVRRKNLIDDHDWGFNLAQLALAGLTAFALFSLIVGIQRGLLGTPDMQIAGNGSSAHFLNWYQDRAGEVLPRAGVLSVPMLVYRLLMLSWALWLAFSLLQWLRWGWEAFSTGGFWRPVKVRRSLKARDGDKNQG